MVSVPSSISNCDRETLETLAFGWYKMLAEAERKLKCSMISRVEVIDKTGRAYIHYLNDEYTELSFQDEDAHGRPRTLKVFINSYGSEDQL